MKTVENEYEAALWTCLGVLGLLTLGVWMLAGCDSERGGKTISAADCIRAEQQHEADIRKEANAPGMPAADQQRIASVMADRAAREQYELAQCSKFQFNQRLELAQASAPRIYLSPQEGSGEKAIGQPSSDRQKQSMALTGHASHPINAGGQAVSGVATASDRFYLRSGLENSANQLVRDSAEREQQSSGAGREGNCGGGAPFGNPVPGKPGYVTSPNPPSQGYIDVRGYSTGTEVIDPYTQQPIRVP
jgi:hypothetical protein